MIQRFVLACTLILCLASTATTTVSAFSTTARPIVPHSLQTRQLSRSSAPLRSSPESAVEEDTDDVTCYVVNDEEIVTEGEKPHVVCTSEPDDYAWFNGVDPQNMREAHGEEEDAELCVEGESFRGKPEWECD
mmetsp:Transcript_41655/g.71313  ORF Transcript_41655/g.71313 Transcript_41655/m.71313 type:complete len:133 (+) Transcript_41655:187-585(+)